MGLREVIGKTEPDELQFDSGPGVVSPETVALAIFGPKADEGDSGALATVSALRKGVEAVERIFADAV